MAETFSLEGKNLDFIGRQVHELEGLDKQLTGALRLICEQNGLEGQWRLDWPNRRLVCLNGNTSLRPEPPPSS